MATVSVSRRVLYSFSISIRFIVASLVLNSPIGNPLWAIDPFCSKAIHSLEGEHHTYLGDHFPLISNDEHPLSLEQLNWLNYTFDSTNEEHQIEILISEIKKEPTAQKSDLVNFSIVELDKKMALLSQLVTLFSNLRNKLFLVDVLSFQLGGDKYETQAKKASDAFLRAQNLIYRDEELYREIKSLSLLVSNTHQKERQKKVSILATGHSLASVDTFLSRWVRKAEMDGVSLPIESKGRLVAIESEIESLGRRFRKNNLQSMTELYFLPGDTHWDMGVPEHRLQSAKSLASGNGHPGEFAFELRQENIDQTHFVLEWAVDPKVRETFFRHYTQRSLINKENAQLAPQIANLRLEKANLLNHSNFAEYRLQLSMLNQPSKVVDFINQMRPHYIEMANKELAELQETRNSHADRKKRIESDPIEPWDVQFWARKHNSQTLGFDLDSLLPFFELYTTVKRSLDFIGRFYGVEFQKVGSMPTWHPDVLVYQAIDQASHRTLGWIYFDLINRKNKPTNASATEIFIPGAYDTALVGSTKMSETPYWHPGAILINLSVNRDPDTGRSFLNLRQVQSLFHELGHGTHFLFQDVPYPIHHAFSAAQDFLEFPSQFLENFGFDPNVLYEIAAHFETGEKPSLTTLRKVVNLRRSQPALRSLARRGLMIDYDMAWHTIETPLQIPTHEFDALVSAQWPLSYVQATANPSPGNDYLFYFGYESQFHSYQWTEVLDYDLYLYQMSLRIPLTELGQNLRSKVLSKAGFVDPMVDYLSVKNGRQPDLTAILKKARGATE